MRIEHNGTEWCGTFANAVRTSLASILHDGPVEGVMVETDTGKAYAGRLLELDAQDTLVLLPAGSVLVVEVDLADVLAVTF